MLSLVTKMSFQRQSISRESVSFYVSEVHFLLVFSRAVDVFYTSQIKSTSADKRQESVSSIRISNQEALSSQLVHKYVEINKKNMS